MEHLMGLLRVHVKRGVNLAIRDVASSDPYVVVKMGKQKLKTRVVKKNINPQWEEDLTLSVDDPTLPVKVRSLVENDPLGEFRLVRRRLSCLEHLNPARVSEEFEIGPFLEAVKMRLENLPSGTIVNKVQPSRQNCLAEESCIIWSEGNIIQNIFLRLRNVERGELELQLQWIDIPGSRGL